MHSLRDRSVPSFHLFKPYANDVVSSVAVFIPNLHQAEWRGSLVCTFVPGKGGTLARRTFLLSSEKSALRSSIHLSPQDLLSPCCISLLLMRHVGLCHLCHFLRKCLVNNAQLSSKLQGRSEQGSQCSFCAFLRWVCDVSGKSSLPYEKNIFFALVSFVCLKTSYSCAHDVSHMSDLHSEFNTFDIVILLKVGDFYSVLQTL